MNAGVDLALVIRAITAWDNIGRTRALTLRESVKLEALVRREQELIKATDKAAVSNKRRRAASAERAGAGA